MPTLPHFIALCLLSLGLALVPGPNMMYLISRSINQGRRAAMISLSGIALAFMCYVIFAALGITALAQTIPYAFDILRISGGVYFGYLAWQALRPGGKSSFHAKKLADDSSGKLFVMGFLTSILNPKIAIFYLTMLPHFITPVDGNVLSQTLVLGFAHITISVSINCLAALAATSLSKFLMSRPRWEKAQRWIMGAVLGAFATRLLTEGRHST